MFESNNHLPETLITDSSVRVGGYILRLEISTGQPIVQVLSEEQRTRIADLDVVAGHVLYDRLRREELARREVDIAENKAAETADEDEQEGEFRSEEVLADQESSIQIFSGTALAMSLGSVKHQEADRVLRVKVVLNSARANGGWRTRPVRDIATIAAFATELRAGFPNFVSAIDALEGALALSLEDPDYTISPILVHGEPGIGKTTFALAVAELLGVPFEMVSAGSLQGGFDLSGSSSHWSNSSAGRVVRLLAEGDSASPVFLIDEVDKIGGDDRFSAATALLDLLEPRTARRYRDEALQLQFDASRLITIMTANDLRSVPLPLQSRALVVEISPPDPGQRLDIVRGLVDQYARELDIDPGSVERISRMGDLRKLKQLVKQAAGLSKARGDRSVFFAAIERSMKSEGKGRAGFV